MQTQLKVSLRRLQLAMCFVAIVYTCVAQDLIVTKDSKRIAAKVTEVNEEDIRYKRFDNLDGPDYVLPKSELVEITYQNGRVETYATHTSIPATSVQTISEPTVTVPETAVQATPEPPTTVPRTAVQTVSDMIPISTADEMAAINYNAESLKGRYILMNDIVVAEWSPIGTERNPFLGVFDGNGHTVTLQSFLMDTTRNMTTSIGLFGVTGRNSLIKNLRIAGNLSYDSNGRTLYMGAIAGTNDGVISCCVSTANINARGGRYTKGKATGQFFLTALASSGNQTNYITYQDEASGGGIVGINQHRIENCYATGRITVSGEGHKNAGGIAGRNGFGDRNRGEIIQCYATGDITAREDAATRHVGGITGLSMPGDVIHSVALNGKIETLGNRIGVTVGGLGLGYPSNMAHGVTSLNFNNRGRMRNAYFRSDMAVFIQKDEEDEKTNKKLKKNILESRGKGVNYGLTQNQNWWMNAQSGVVYPFGADEKSPWVWNGNLKRPVLYWENEQ